MDAVDFFNHTLNYLEAGDTHSKLMPHISIKGSRESLQLNHFLYMLKCYRIFQQQDNSSSALDKIEWHWETKLQLCLIYCKAIMYKISRIKLIGL